MVCNVQKGVGISTSYSSLLNSFEHDFTVQSISNDLLRELRNLRVNIVENIFNKNKSHINTHNLVSFHNSISEHVGVEKIDDEHAHPVTITQEHLNDFKNVYTVDRIVKHVGECLNNNPKKFSYVKFEEWLCKNCPSHLKSYDFCTQVCMIIILLLITRCLMKMDLLILME